MFCPDPAGPRSGETETVRRAICIGALLAATALSPAAFGQLGPAPAEADPGELLGAPPVAGGEVAQESLYRRLLRWLGIGDPAPSPPAIVGSPVERPVRLFEDEAIISLSGERFDISEKSGRLQLEVRRRVSVAQSVRARIETVAGSAQPGRDFQFKAEEIVFAPAETTKTVEIEIVDNEEYRPGRNFQVKLTPVGPGRVDIGVATVNIEEDDQPPQAPRRGQLEARPAELSLGGLDVGLTSEHVLQLANSGSRPVRLEKVELGGGQGQISIVSDACMGSSTVLPPGGLCALTIGFAPQNAGPVKGTVLVSWREDALPEDGGAAGQGGGQLRSGVLSVAIGGLSIEPPPPYDPRAERIEAARRLRLQSRPAVGTTLTPPQPAAMPPAWRLTDDDYRKIGIIPNHLTLPLRRERIVTTDRIIPCVLETGIISERAGGVICVVESHVYGSDGRFILIPAGTRVEGDYEPLGRNGESRLNILWKRFIRPDGSSFYTKAGFQAHDMAGHVGLPGEVDNRWFEKYGSALFVTMLSTAAGFAVPERNTAGSEREALFADRANTAQRSLSEGLLNVARQQLEENLDLRPVIRIRPGERLIIRPTLDLWLPVPEVLVPTAERSATAQVATGGAGRRASSGNATRPPPVQGRPGR